MAKKTVAKNGIKEGARTGIKAGTKTELSVGEVAERSGLAISAIHFYENKGLIRSRRNNGNHRRYARGVLRKLAVIKVAQRAGISLAEIKTQMEQLGSDKTVSGKDWETLAQSWRNDLNERIERLTRMRDTLGFCIGCGCLSTEHCQLVNPDDKLAQQQPDGAYYLNPDNAMMNDSEWQALSEKK